MCSQVFWKLDCFLFWEEKKVENLHLSAKLESNLQTVALEYSGLSDDLSRTDSVSSNFNAAMDVSALCHYGSVCISEHSIGGNDGNRLHGLCVSVFRDRTAVILLEVRTIMKNKKNTSFGLQMMCFFLLILCSRYKII